MFTIKRILVPVDFAPCSKRAVEIALALAEKFAAEVEIFHIWYGLVTNARSAGPPLDKLAHDEAAKMMKSFLDTIAVPEGVRLDWNVIFGVPRESILAHAEAFDLVVMGTHGRSGMSRFIQGSVTESVIRECCRPVLVVNAR